MYCRITKLRKEISKIKSDYEIEKDIEKSKCDKMRLELEEKNNNLLLKQHKVDIEKEELQNEFDKLKISCNHLKNDCEIAQKHKKELEMKQIQHTKLNSCF